MLETLDYIHTIGIRQQYNYLNYVYTSIIQQGSQILFFQISMKGKGFYC